MNRYFFGVVIRWGLLAVPIAAASDDERPLPRPGLWEETGTATHYDRAGRPVVIDGVIIRRRSERHCMSASEVANFYVNPLPTCQFNLKREGPGTYRAIAACPASGVRFNVVRHVTLDAIDTRSVQTGADGARVESVSHSVRIGECVATIRQAQPDPNAPRPIVPPATWFQAEDYPAAALRSRVGGRVGWEVDVDGGGGVTACRVVTSSNNATLDAATCAVLRQRGAFQSGHAGVYGSHTSWLPPPK